MTKYFSIFFVFIWTFGADSFAQDSLTSNRLIIKRGQKQFDLNMLTILEINQTLVSNGKDSVYISIIPDSIYKINDTMYIIPLMVEEYSLLDINNPPPQKKHFDKSSKTVLKVPLNQIVKIRAKKQPAAFILGTATTLAYITYMTSIFVAVENPEYTDPGIKTFLISGAVLIIVWPSYFIWGKKRFWFHAKKNKKTWTF